MASNDTTNHLDPVIEMSPNVGSDLSPIVPVHGASPETVVQHEHGDNFANRTFSPNETPVQPPSPPYDIDNTDQFPALPFLPEVVYDDDEPVDVTAGILQLQLQSWHDQCDGEGILNRYYNFWKSEDFLIYQDVQFQIGQNKVLIGAHKLILSAVCENLKFPDRSTKTIEFADLDPEAFMSALQFIYTEDCEDIKFSDVIQAKSVLRVAQKLGIPELQANCTAFIGSNIDCRTALRIFCSGTEDERLKEIATSFIVRNIREIFSSAGFLELSGENLLHFLQSEDWFIDDELHVFKSVITWATQKINRPGQSPVTPSGSQLRSVIGEAIYQIRFTAIGVRDFLRKVCSPYSGLFTQEESLAISTYLVAIDVEKGRNDDDGEPAPAAPPNFNTNCRVKKDIVKLPIPTVDDGMEDSVSSGQVFENGDDDPFNEILRPIPITDEDVSEMSGDRENPSTPMEVEEYIPIIIEVSPTDVMINETETSVCSPPPKKKRKRCNKMTKASVSVVDTNVPSPYDPVSPSQTVDVTKLNCLHDYVMNLKYMGNREEISRIDETVKIPTLPQTRVYLPSLKEFRLTLTHNSDFKHGTAFKTYIKLKLGGLPNILFFDTRQSDCSPEPESVLSELMNTKVNVSLDYLDKLLFLKINHEEGSIVMNFIKDSFVQEILNGSNNFPLKSLNLSDCDLDSLDKVRTDLLEVIVFRRVNVKGVGNNVAFLQKCTKLKSLSWHDLNNEEVNLTEDLLNRNPHLKKLSLAKCKLTVTGNLNEHQNFLHELYLDICEFKSDVTTSLPKLFPYVKRIQVYGTNCDSFLLYNILQMESIQWIFLWKMNYIKVKRGSRKASTLTEESEKIQNFLSSVFDVDSVRKKQITFVLTKDTLEVPGTSSSALQQATKDCFDASCWKGEMIKTHAEGLDHTTKLDFKHFSYDTFFYNYREFCLLSSTPGDLKKEEQRLEKERKRKKQEVVVTESVVANNPSPATSNSTDEVVDIMDCY